ncbi:MAG TPA: MFS transporter [Terriglobia bacterium]|jgi:MHS family alpha-ketoglutarate permease-like MFS transporter
MREASTIGPAGFTTVGGRLKAIFVGSIGNLVEWYDFYAYTAFALYFANSFFPGRNPVIQQLNAAILFAIGFVMRPIGGWLFGHLADNYGRRKALMLSVLLMCFGSLMIAATPTSASIGTAAPFILGLARVIQGLSLGGEYGASATYLAEIAGEKHRGFYVSFHYVTLIGGQLFAILILLVLQQVFLTPEQMRAWGWRIPFLVGALLALTALTMRSNLPETDAFIETKKRSRRESSIRTLLRYPRQALIVVGLTAGGTTAFYTYTTYMQKFLKLSVGLSDNRTTIVSAGSLIFALCLQPIYGALSDRVGRRPLLIWFGLLGTIFTIPLLRALQAARTGLGAFVLIALAWLIVAGYTSINAVVKAELFPTAVRATGVGLPYAITTSIFGGPAESIALWFKSIGHEVWFSYYLTCVIAIALIVSLIMRDTKRYSAIGGSAE